VRVLLVEDRPEERFLVRTALRLRARIEIVGEAVTSFGAAQLAAELEPDIVVLDLALPDSMGRDTYLRVREAAPQARVVIYSGHTSDRDWYDKAGVPFVPKEGSLDPLVRVVESVAGDGPTAE
jgi:DNA-binding NarL/FixJ family response regulator